MSKKQCTKQFFFLIKSHIFLLIQKEKRNSTDKLLEISKLKFSIFPYISDIFVHIYICFM